MVNNSLVKNMDREMNQGIRPFGLDSFESGELIPSSNMSKLKFNIIKMYHFKFKKILYNTFNYGVFITVFSFFQYI